MIIYPNYWDEVGQEITIESVESAIVDVLEDIDCNYLAFSGGIDSTLMLYFMLQKYDIVNAFTIGSSKDHPDIVHAKLVADRLNTDELRVNLYCYIPTLEYATENIKLDDFAGDNAVRMLYNFVSRYTHNIIACDGVDEFVCGYYDHQKDPSEITYYDYIRRLQREQLQPLNNNSGNVKVYLPYIDDRITCLLSKIPISDKVDECSRKKTMLALSNGRVPNEVLLRRKYGFCDAMRIKE